MRHRPATCDGCGKPLWRDYLSTAGLDICCCLKSSKTLPQMYDERVEEISRLRAELADCRALLAVYGDRAEELRESCEEKQRCIDSSVQAQRTFLAEIGHLRAELAEAKKFKDGMLDVLGGACPKDHRATPFDEFKGCTPCLRAELAEYKQDAERYRYLRKNPAMLLHLSNREFDHAIDAARKGEGDS